MVDCASWEKVYDRDRYIRLKQVSEQNHSLCLYEGERDHCPEAKNAGSVSEDGAGGAVEEDGLYHFRIYILCQLWQLCKRS